MSKYRIVKTSYGGFIVQKLFVSREINVYRGLTLPPYRGDWANISPILETIEIAGDYVKNQIDNETFEVVKVYE